MALEPQTRLVLDDRATLRHDEDILGAEALDELLDRLEHSIHCRRLHEVLSVKTGVGSVVDERVNDDSPDIDADAFGYCDHLFCW